jgi:hypothetical protein
MPVEDYKTIDLLNELDQRWINSDDELALISKIYQEYKDDIAYWSGEDTLYDRINDLEELLEKSFQPENLQEEMLFETFKEAMNKYSIIELEEKLK